jgi:hypothetical protein
MLALIAGQGALPGQVAKARPDAVICELEGYPAGLGAARRSGSSGSARSWRS